MNEYKKHHSRVNKQLLWEEKLIFSEYLMPSENGFMKEDK